MKKILVFLCILMSVSSFAQTKLYLHDDVDSYVQKTKTIAILQLSTDIKLRPKELKGFSQEQIVDMEKDEAFNNQKAMYSWFLTRKKRGTLLVDVQNPTTTNALLKKAGIDPSESYGELASDLCEVLGVDVVITGTFETNKPMSNAAALGLAVIGIGGTTQNATINLDFVFKDNEVVVNYLKNVKGGLGSSSDDLVNTLMRKTSRRIPYTS